MTQSTVTQGHGIIYNALLDVRIRLAKSYEVLTERTVLAMARADAASNARKALAEARADIIREYAADPKLLGSNEAAREATIQGMTVEQRAAVEKAEAEQRTADHALSLQRIEVEAARADLRCLEALVAERGHED